MAKPVDNKEDKNPNNKKEVNPNVAMMINTVVIVVAILLGMVIMYILLNSSIDRKISKILPEGQEQVEGDEEDDEEKAPAKHEGILLDLGDFVLNLADVNARRYIKVGVALELSKTRQELEEENAPKEKSGGHGHGESEAADPNAAIIAEMERYKPVIKDAINSIISNKTSDELSTSIGKEMAKDEIIEAVNGIFDNHRKVMRVSFGTFIIQ